MTGNCLDSTLTTGGGILKSLLLVVKSSTLNVADMMINFSGESGVFFNRKGTIRDKTPMRISVKTDRS